MKDTEELLKLLEQAEDKDVDIVDEVDTVISFVSKYQIESGDHQVSTRLLHDLYKKTCLEPIEYVPFYNRMCKFVPTTAAHCKHFCSINKKALKISDELFKLDKTTRKNIYTNKACKRQFDRFLKRYEIKSGDHYVQSYVLEYLYTLYCSRHTKKRQLKYRNFLRFCNIYFDNKRITSSKVKWYGVDESIKQYISDETIERLEKARSRNGKKEKSKNSKKSSEVSSS